jgi:hypothetical protein
MGFVDSRARVFNTSVRQQDLNDASKESRLSMKESWMDDKGHAKLQ